LWNSYFRENFLVLLIGIVGDTHNNLVNISKICQLFNSKKVNLVIHTGDISLPKALYAFKELNCKMIGVFGNNDQGDKEALVETSKELNFEFFNGPHFLKVENIVFSIIHDPLDIDEEMMSKSNVIFHGHTHRFRCEKIKNVLIFNPGECAGFMKNKNQIGIFDTEKNTPRILSF
tara:strand:+ start:1719 stop:2243 length:525 start_codon:yes stop_codon:yes gene_type:complete